MNPDSAVAVVGIGCRFPDAWSPADFWRNLDDGVVSCRPLPEDRLRAAGVPDELLDADDYVTVAATLPAVDEFAGEFFGYPPGEAELIDPQQRIFLEACWEALESAGHPARDGHRQVAVFAGASFSTYATLLYLARARTAGAAALNDVDLYLGGVTDFLASRVAYRLGLHGPSVAVQTACSSSLTAVHYATLSLLAGECDIALAGGTGLETLDSGYRYQPGGLLSEDGYCRAFDRRSTGTARGAGVGAVALRRLSDALADGDPVLAVVCGSAAGNDGADRPGFTAPSPAGVASVVSAALGVAEVSGDAVRYVEAHGSGTPLGDQVELAGLTDGLRATTDRTGFCGLGSVKVNIGHAESAAGIAGLIKAVHVVRTGRVPPHPLFERPREEGLLADSPFRVPTEPETCPDEDRYVLVNSMGLGGTNAAVVLAPPPEAHPAAGAGPRDRAPAAVRPHPPRARRRLPPARGRAGRRRPRGRRRRAHAAGRPQRLRRAAGGDRPAGPAGRRPPASSPAGGGDGQGARPAAGAGGPRRGRARGRRRAVPAVGGPRARGRGRRRGAGVAAGGPLRDGGRHGRGRAGRAAAAGRP